MQRLRTALLWLLSVALALVMITQGWDKFSSAGRWARSFADWSYPAWFRLFIGVLETGGGAALFIPRLARWGSLVLATVMVGAVGTWLLNGRLGDAATPLVYCLLLLWIAWERRLGVRRPVPPQTDP